MHFSLVIILCEKELRVDMEESSYLYHSPRLYVEVFTYILIFSSLFDMVC